MVSSDEMKMIRFRDSGTLVSFRGALVGSVSGAWDVEKQEERPEFDIFELYVDKDEKYHLLKKKGRSFLSSEESLVLSHQVFEDLDALCAGVKGSPAEEILRLGLKQRRRL